MARDRLGAVTGLLRGYVGTHGAAVAGLDVEEVATIVDVLARAVKLGSQVFVIGNGGSASTAGHLAADITLNVCGPERGAPRVISLCENPATLTCIANDLAFDDVFRHQLASYARPGDVIIAVSGSGKSPNIVRALEFARASGVTTVALLGFDGGVAVELADHAVIVDSDDFGVIEDLHVMINHMLVEGLRLVLGDDE